MYEHSCHINHDAKAAVHVDAFMRNVDWKKVGHVSRSAGAKQFALQLKETEMEKLISSIAMNALASSVGARGRIATRAPLYRCQASAERIRASASPNAGRSNLHHGDGDYSRRPTVREDGALILSSTLVHRLTGRGRACMNTYKGTAIHADARCRTSRGEPKHSCGDATDDNRGEDT